MWPLICQPGVQAVPSLPEVSREVKSGFSLGLVTLEAPAFPSTDGNSRLLEGARVCLSFLQAHVSVWDVGVFLRDWDALQSLLLPLTTASPHYTPGRRHDAVLRQQAGQEGFLWQVRPILGVLQKQ